MDEARRSDRRSADVLPSSRLRRCLQVAAAVAIPSERPSDAETNLARACGSPVEGCGQLRPQNPAAAPLQRAIMVRNKPIDAIAAASSAKTSEHGNPPRSVYVSIMFAFCSKSSRMSSPNRLFRLRSCSLLRCMSPQAGGRCVAPYWLAVMQLDDLAVLQGDAAVHAGGEVEIVGRDHGGEAGGPDQRLQGGEDVLGRVGSRLPVGSSASRMRGALATARAMATRCCSPPESSAGRCVRRWPRPRKAEVRAARSRAVWRAGRGSAAAA